VGLHEKRAVANLELRNNLNICFKTEENHQKPLQDGRFRSMKRMRARKYSRRVDESGKSWEELEIIVGGEIEHRFLAGSQGSPARP
jgi:hypothetical protein